MSKANKKTKVAPPGPEAFRTVFTRLRGLLQAQASRFKVGHDTADHYSLEAVPGPATLQAWGGKLKSQTIPVAWVQIGKAYVSYHLMGVYGHPKLLERYSEKLKARMQGKSCFNFQEIDEPLFAELERLTIDSLTGMQQAGYVKG